MNEGRLFWKGEDLGASMASMALFKLTPGTAVAALQGNSLLSGCLCSAQMVPGVFHVTSLSSSLEEADIITHSR